MGWRGTLRTITAAARAVERDAQKRQKIAFKAQVVASASEAVAAWEAHINNLTRVLDKPSVAIDWKSIAAQPAPLEPHLSSKHADAAQRALNSFRPKFFDFLIGGSEKRRQKLQAAADRAPELDAADYSSAKNIYAKAYQEWRADAELAANVLGHDPKALKKVLEEERPFADNGLIGSSMAFTFDESFVHAVPTIRETEIVPDVRLKQTSTGKLSETKMPATQFNEIYQDYVASVPLRIASIAFAVLPIDELYVTCVSMMLNTNTGHQELTPILSVLIVRDTFRRLDISRVDPSDALSNFKHVMQFKKTVGFQRIEPLKPI